MIAEEKMNAMTREYRISTIIEVILRDIMALLRSLSNRAPVMNVSNCIFNL